MAVDATVHVIGAVEYGLAKKFTMTFAAKPETDDLLRMRIRIGHKVHGFNFRVGAVWHESNGDANAALIVNIALTSLFNPAAEPSAV
jgi:hypothetical protein